MNVRVPKLVSGLVPGLTPLARRVIGTAGIVLVLVASLVLSRVADDPLRFPVSRIDVLGTLDYTDRRTLRERLGPHLALGFHGLDIAAVRREVESLPWVADARVSRVWPDALSIDIDEHTPAARWNGDSLVSERLALFRPPQLAADHPRGADWRALLAALPRLEGSDGRHEAVLADFRRYAAGLGRGGATLVALEEDGRLSQTLRLESGVTVRLGYEDRSRRFARFLDVHERLVTPLGARFDMRYGNGFAFSGAGAGGATTDQEGEFE